MLHNNWSLKQHLYAPVENKIMKILIFVDPRKIITPKICTCMVTLLPSEPNTSFMVVQ